MNDKFDTDNGRDDGAFIRPRRAPVPYPREQEASSDGMKVQDEAHDGHDADDRSEVLWRNDRLLFISERRERCR